MKKDCLFYVASPYSHPIAAVRYDRFGAVCSFCAKMLGHDFHVFSPICHSHPIAEAGDVRTDFDFWRAWNLLILGRCDALIVLELDGWTTSVGVNAEIEFAREHSIPCFPAPRQTAWSPVWMRDLQAAMEAMS